MPFTAIPSTDRVEYNTVQCLRKRISATSPLPTQAVNVAGAASTVVNVGSLPPGAIVVGGTIWVSTLFNSSGTDTISVGTINSAGTATTSVWATTVDVSSAGFKAFTLTTTPGVTTYSDTSDLTVTTTYAQSVTDASAGTADIIIFFVLRPVV